MRKPLWTKKTLKRKPSKKELKVDATVVNTKEVELLNTVTPDGKYFIFHRDGYYWMDAKIIEELKQSVF